MMNNQSKDADSKARARAEQSARREREAERRRKAEEERRRREAERKAEAQRRAREEERKRKEEQARQEALEAAQSGWQPPQVQNREQARTGTLTDAAAKLDGLIEGIRNSARAGTKPPASQSEQWQPNTIRKATEKDAPQSYAEAVYGGAKAQPKEAETRMAGQLMAGKAKAQAGPYTRTLMDNVLAHEGDTDDPFLMELNSESWEQEYKDDRTKAFKDAVERLADQLMTGKAKPEEAVPAREKRETTVTSGDLADPFLQGLFGEQELKDEFVKGQLKQFAPALERRIAQLREKVSGNKVSGQTEEERQKDTAYGTNMVYTMKKDEAWPTREELITGRTEIDPRMAGNIMQPMSAGASNPPQENANDKTSTEAAQFGWQAPQQGNAETQIVLSEEPAASGISRDESNHFTAGGLGVIVGMKYDEQTGMIYHSKGAGLQKHVGYGDFLDYAATLLFDLKNPKSEATYVDENGQERNVVHRVWMGDYTGGSLMKPLPYRIAKEMGQEFSGYYGGESSILFSSPEDGWDWYQQEDAFEQSITVKDKEGNEIVHFDSAEMYADKTSDWVYACKESEHWPAYIEGTIRGDNQAALEALAGVQSEGGIVYGRVVQGKDGMYYLTWSYTIS
ncbi:hypothetical protein CE91St36_07140 [Christensenellaceae bacterium]|nr:hypothetical protein CE91St36_07140 [Christensenellaceae bacterium]BDF60565.1 hypothetical protein CE91St37_07150 [Christensenellaceae bacterium]